MRCEKKGCGGSGKKLVLSTAVRSQSLTDGDVENRSRISNQMESEMKVKLHQDKSAPNIITLNKFHIFQHNL